MSIITTQNPNGGRPSDKVTRLLKDPEDSIMSWRLGHVRCDCGNNVAVSAGLGYINKLAETARETRTYEEQKNQILNVWWRRKLYKLVMGEYRLENE